MPDYKKMYALLCGAVSDSIDELAGVSGAGRARCALRRNLLDAEELYLSAPAPQLIDARRLIRLAAPPEAGKDGEEPSKVNE